MSKVIKVWVGNELKTRIIGKPCMDPEKKNKATGIMIPLIAFEKYHKTGKLSVFCRDALSHAIENKLIIKQYRSMKDVDCECIKTGICLSSEFKGKLKLLKIENLSRFMRLAIAAKIREEQNEHTKRILHPDN